MDRTMNSKGVVVAGVRSANWNDLPRQKGSSHKASWTIPPRTTTELTHCHLSAGVTCGVGGVGVAVSAPRSGHMVKPVSAAVVFVTPGL